MKIFKATVLAGIAFSQSGVQGMEAMDATESKEDLNGNQVQVDTTPDTTHVSHEVPTVTLLHPSEAEPDAPRQRPAPRGGCTGCFAWLFGPSRGGRRTSRRDVGDGSATSPGDVAIGDGSATSPGDDHVAIEERSFGAIVRNGGNNLVDGMYNPVRTLRQTGRNAVVLPALYGLFLFLLTRNRFLNEDHYDDPAAIVQFGLMVALELYAAGAYLVFLLNPSHAAIYLTIVLTFTLLCPEWGDAADRALRRLWQREFSMEGIRTELVRELGVLRSAYNGTLDPTAAAVPVPEFVRRQRRLQRRIQDSDSDDSELTPDDSELTPGECEAEGGQLHANGALDPELFTCNICYEGSEANRTIVFCLNCAGGNGVVQHHISCLECLSKIRRTGDTFHCPICRRDLLDAQDQGRLVACGPGCPCRQPRAAAADDDADEQN